MTMKELFLASAQYLWEKGWRQGRNGGCGGPACAQGAMAEACGDLASSNVALEQYLAAKRVFAGVIGLPNAMYTIPEWNDTPGRTKEEVIAAFERAAEAS